MMNRLLHGVDVSGSGNGGDGVADDVVDVALRESWHSQGSNADSNSSMVAYNVRNADVIFSVMRSGRSLCT